LKKFIAELLRVAQEAGVTVHSDTAVEHLTHDDDKFINKTARGQVTERQVMIRTNAIPIR